MNSCDLSGRLGSEPETFAPQNSEYSVIKFSIANNDESKKDASGNLESVTSWFDIEFWTKNPQAWLKKLYKGTEIVVPCKAKQSTWEKDGQKRSKVIFKVANGQFPLIIQGKNEQQQAPPATQPAQDGSFPVF